MVDSGSSASDGTDEGYDDQTQELTVIRGGAGFRTVQSWMMNDLTIAFEKPPDAMNGQEEPPEDFWIPAQARRLRHWPKPLVMLYILKLVREQMCEMHNRGKHGYNRGKDAIEKATVPNGLDPRRYRRQLRDHYEKFLHEECFSPLRNGAFRLAGFALILLVVIAAPVVVQFPATFAVALIFLGIGAVAVWHGLRFLSFVSFGRLLFPKVEFVIAIFGIAWSANALRARPEALVAMIAQGVLAVGAYVVLSTLMEFVEYIWIRHRTDPAAIVTGMCLHLMHLADGHEDTWHQRDVRTAAASSFQTIALIIRGYLSRELAPSGRRARKKVRHTADELAAWITSESEQVFGDRGPQKTFALAQQVLTAASQRAWLSLPREEVSPRPAGRFLGSLRILIVTVLLIAVMAGLRQLNVMPSGVESVGWAVIGLYFAISVASMIDPDLASRLGMVGNFFDVLGKGKMGSSGNSRESDT